MPWFFPPNSVATKSESPYAYNEVLSPCAFVQAPQEFRSDYSTLGKWRVPIIGMEMGDINGHGNKTFFYVHQHGRDGCVETDPLALWLALV